MKNAKELGITRETSSDASANGEAQCHDLDSVNRVDLFIVLKLPKSQIQKRKREKEKRHSSEEKLAGTPVNDLD